MKYICIYSNNYRTDLLTFGNQKKVKCTMSFFANSKIKCQATNVTLKIWY